MNYEELSKKNNNKYIYLVCGRSGCGKDTIVDEICKRLKMKKILSYTTRPPRKNELSYPKHTFVSDEEFDNIPKNNMVAYTKFDNYRYCATYQQVEENDFYIIDIEGIKYFKKKYKGNKVPIVILIECDENKLYTRMINRGDDSIQAWNRIYHDDEAFKGAIKLSDCVIWNNGDLEDSVNKVISFIYSIGGFIKKEN